MILKDKFNRVIDYVRIAVTDKCNLRCQYCMPEEGISFVKKEKLCTYEELLRLCSIMGKQGVRKVRITGGEPFLRKDIMTFLRELSALPEIDQIAITTNGTHTLQYMGELLSLGIRKFNLSIDSLNRERFHTLTRRDLFPEVIRCLQRMIHLNVDLKINAVVLAGKNTEDIIPMVALSKANQLSVRFIEEMPFNGDGHHYENLEWNYVKILDHIHQHFGAIEKMPDPKGSTSLNYRIPYSLGSFGIIPAYSRTFCGSCNRIRITPEGKLKTCLYDEGIFNLRDFMRSGASDQEIAETVRLAVSHKLKDGFAAEQARSNNPQVSESMATIGG